MIFHVSEGVLGREIHNLASLKGGWLHLMDQTVVFYTVLREKRGEMNGWWQVLDDEKGYAKMRGMPPDPQATLRLWGREPNM